MKQKPHIVFRKLLKPLWVLALLMVVIFSWAQKHTPCNCEKENSFLAANLSVIQDQNNTASVKMNCFDELRIMINRDGKGEVCENEVSCISQNKITYQLSKEFRIENMENVSFVKKIIYLKKHIVGNVFSIRLNKNKEIERIAIMGSSESWGIAEEEMIDSVATVSTLATAVPDEFSATNNCEEDYGTVWNLYKDEQYEASLSLINKVIKNCPENSAYYEMKAYNLIKLKRNKEIIEACKKGLAIDPEKASLYEIRGNTYYFEFEPQKALADYRQMLQYDKANARYYNNYLKLLNELRNDDEMIEVFGVYEKERNEGTAFKDERFIGEIYFYSSLAFQRKKNTAKAVELLNNALQLKPDAVPYLINRGSFLDELKQYDEAIRDLSKAIAIEPDNVLAHINRSGAYLGKKDLESARKDLLKILAIGVDNIGVYADLANIYLQQKDYQNAKKYFEVYLAKNEKNASGLSNYAYTLFELDEWQNSLLNFQKAYALDKKEIDVLVGLVVLYQLNGDRKNSTRIAKEIKANTNFTAEKSLLKKLMETHYFYSEKFLNEWQKIFK